MFAFCVACDDFIPDPIEPRLPFYGGLGRNEAGAILNGEFFINNPTPAKLGRGSQPPQILIFGSDSLVLEFSIRTRDFNQNNKIKIRLDQLDAQDWTSMTQGFGKAFRLTDPKIKVKIVDANDFLEENVYLGIDAVPGQITVKLLPNEKIVFGTFGFRAENAAGNTIQVSLGRFDYEFMDF